MEGYRELSADVSGEYEALKDNVHRFAREVLRPAAIALDRMANPQDVIARSSPLHEVLRSAYRLGYHAAGIPAQFGGLGLGGLGTHILLEEMGWGSADLALSIGVASFPFSSIAASGNTELIERFVGPFVADRKAEYIGCWAITEPSHGSDTLFVRSDEFHSPRISGQAVAMLDGDDYVLNGQKAAWVSNGTIATHALVYLTIEPAKGMAGGGIAFVPLNLPGVSKGKPLNKLGQRALNQGEIFFDEVRIPRSHMLIGPEAYEGALAHTLTFANASMGAVFTGVARAAFECALAYARQRVQGGKPISEHQLIQKHLFEMFTKVEACRALSRATMIYNESAANPSLENSIAAKTFCTQAAFEVANEAVQIFGGNGLSKEYEIEKLFRDARASLIEDGTNDVLSLAGARHILNRARYGRPAFQAAQGV